MSECLHCDINELIRERLEQPAGADIADLAGRMAESLAELILLAPESEHAKLMADTLAYFGQCFLERSGAIDGEAGAARH
jgi:hypothetical protein